MFHLRHRSLIILAGSLWVFVGLYLLPLGLKLLTQESSSSGPLLSFLGPLFLGVDYAVVFLIALGLIIGFLKGRTVMAKSVKRVVSRIKSLPDPSPVYQVYSLPYYVLIGCMILLGISLKVFQVPTDVRGLVDVAIGAALINGGVLYFRNSAA